MTRAPLLALHTTEAGGGIAVQHAGAVLAREIAAGGKHAAVLLDVVLDVLREAGLRVADLGGLAVTTGPGSFTGIRVGLATAQGLALARGLAVHACDSLKARAAAHAGGAPAVGVVLDARRGEVYAAVYALGQAGPQLRGEPVCASPAAAAAALALQWKAPDTIQLEGSAADRVAPLFAGHPGGVRATAGPAGAAVATALLALAPACPAQDARSLVPTYLRKSDAELARDRTCS